MWVFYVYVPGLYEISFSQDIREEKSYEGLRGIGLKLRGCFLFSLIALLYCCALWQSVWICPGRKWTTILSYLG